MIDLARVVRRLTGLSLWRSKDLATRTPAVVLHGVPREAAEAAVAALRAVGAAAEAREQATPALPRTPTTTHQAPQGRSMGDPTLPKVPARDLDGRRFPCSGPWAGSA
ncbi:ribosomal protein L7/L12 [Streptomyces bobili]|uniref:ribosomal protein L7/L12 n=1 Tax=Streptomyces bobili TaxID=67280 RepID=UPI003F4DB6FC